MEVFYQAQFLAGYEKFFGAKEPMYAARRRQNQLAENTGSEDAH